MTWVKLDDLMPQHPKILRAGPAAAWLWVCGLAYCSRMLTDGAIPAEAVGSFGVPSADRLAGRLTDVGLWEKTADGYQVHDYHDYQPSKEQVLARRELRRTAGRLGGQHSGTTRRSKTEANTKQVASSLLRVCLPVASTMYEANVNPDPDPLSTPSPVKNTGEGESASPTPLPPSTDEADTAPAKPGTKADALADLWNATTTSPLPRCREVTPDRRRKIAARLKERPLEEWRQVFERVEASPFCRGSNDRGWLASFDWVIRSADQAVKVLEGKYDGHAEAHADAKSATAPVPEVWQAVLDRLAAHVCQRDLNAWFRPLVCVRDDGDRVVVRASEAVVAYLRRNFKDAFAAALAEARPGLRVEWQSPEEVA